jgi:hemoglobin-like flavoprotein
MTPDQVHLVKSTWQQVLPIQAAAADLFYGRLFEIAPEVRPMFKRDIHAQGAMLMSTLNTVVRSLHDLNAVLPGPPALGPVPDSPRRRTAARRPPRRSCCG